MKRKGVKVHIFNLDEESKINECLQEVRLAEHGVQMIPGTFFKQGKVCIFENLEPLEDEDEVVKIGHTNEEMLRAIDQKWRKFQSALQEVDTTLSYYRPRVNTGSGNTKMENQKILREHEALRKDILARMAMAKLEAQLIVSGRYPQLELRKADTGALTLAFELPELDGVDPEQVYGKKEETVKGPRSGS
jgi:hypothetical protein